MRRIRSLLYPRGTYRAPSLFFRGGDGICEPEIMRKKYLEAMFEYNRVKKDYDEAKKEFDQAQAELADLDECILKIAQNMGGDSRDTTEFANLQAKIQQLHMDIEDIEKEIEEVSEPLLPYQNIGLVNEHAQFKPAMKDMHDSLDADEDNTLKMKKEIGTMLLSEDFSNSVESLIEKHVAQDVKYQIRKALNQSQNRINQSKSSDTGKINQCDDDDLMAKLDHYISVCLDNLEFKLQKNLAKTHHKVFIKMEIDRLNEMNEFLDLMQMHDSCADTDEIYEHCMAEEEDNDEEEENNDQNTTDEAQQQQEQNPNNEEQPKEESFQQKIKNELNNFDQSNDENTQQEQSYSNSSPQQNQIQNQAY